MSHAFEHILAIDSDKWACATFAANFPDVKVVCSPVADCIGGLPDCSILLGGPPCQPFSTAGKGHGSSDARDGIPDYIAAVARVKPRHFLMENVAGLLNRRHAEYFSRVLSLLGAAGYAVEHRLLDAVAFGVPQFRRRVWVWGVRRDLYAAGIRHHWPVPTHAWPPPEAGLFGGPALAAGVTVGEALDLDGYIRHIRGVGVVRRDHPTTEPSPTIYDLGCTGTGLQVIQECDEEETPALCGVRQATGSKDGGSGGGSGGGRDVSRRVRPGPVLPRTDGCAVRVWGGGRNHPADENGVYRRDKRDITDEPCTTVAGLNGATTPTLQILDAQNDTLHPLAEPCGTIQRAQAKGGRAGHYLAAAADPVAYRWSDAMLTKHPPAAPDEPSPTVQAKWWKGGAEGLLALNAAWKRKGELWVRRLTPLECARLQSVPDSFVWPEDLSKTAAYRIVGNGMACGMTAALSRSLSAADPDARTVVSLFCGGGLGDVGFHGRHWTYDPATAEARPA